MTKKPQNRSRTTENVKVVAKKKSFLPEVRLYMRYIEIDREEERERERERERESKVNVYKEKDIHVQLDICQIYIYK